MFESIDILCQVKLRSSEFERYKYFLWKASRHTVKKMSFEKKILKAPKKQKIQKTLKKEKFKKKFKKIKPPQLACFFHLGSPVRLIWLIKAEFLIAADATVACSCSNLTSSLFWGGLSIFLLLHVSRYLADSYFFSEILSTQFAARWN